ncbi:MAG TPA: type II toxin-antitoxin system PemK/MazF family toxin [Sulfurimonas autotrophica]|nr:type II toxin-antitoxin system PemK/MazF family toxin [Sulfurimonas autotrophica]
MRKGDVYLVEFGKSRDTFEFGKSRPVIIFQTDKLNFAVEEDMYDYFLVIPLSTKEDMLTEEFRLKIDARDDLKQDSFAVCNSICFLHKKYFKQKLSSLNDNEIVEIENIFKNVFDMR